MLELRNRAKDLEEHPTDRRRRIDALIKHDQINLTSLQVVGQLNQMLQRSAEAIEFGDHDLITGAHHQQRPVKFGAASQLARRGFDENLITPAAANASR